MMMNPTVELPQYIVREVVQLEVEYVRECGSKAVIVNVEALAVYDPLRLYT